MHVLMTETVSPPAHLAAETLRSAGHEVHRCHDDDSPGFPCSALRGRDCPLEVDPIDVVVTVRPEATPRPTQSEDGVVCGVRRKVPLVVAGSAADDPWRRWEATSPAGTQVLEAVEAVAASALAEHSAVATATLRRTLELAGIEVDRAEAEVRRHNGGLVVRVATEPPLGKEANLRAAVRICQDLREIDPWARSIDVTGGTRR